MSFPDNRRSLGNGKALYCKHQNISTINHNDDWQVIQGELGDQQDQGIGSTVHSCC